MSVEKVSFYFLGGDPIPYIGLVPINPRSSLTYKQVRMRLDDDEGKGLQLVPGSYGMSVPSACTIVFISG